MNLAFSNSSFFFDGFMFRIVPIFIFLTFIFVFGVIIFRMIQGLKQWKENNDSPILSVAAIIVSKRADVRNHSNHNNNVGTNTSSSSTTYFVTFEVESGDRLEFIVDGAEYGQLVENDTGILTFQGTRYQGFDRNRN